MIDRQIVDKVLNATSIIEVLSDFISLTKKGVNYQACCPFHDEKTPSFVASQAKGFYKCFGCGKGGNAVTFLMEHESMTFVEAIKYLGKKYGIEVVDEELSKEQVEANNDRESMMLVTDFARGFFCDRLVNSSEGKNVGLSYFQERGFTRATVDKFQLGYCPSKGDMMTLKALEEGYKEEFLIKTGLTIKQDNRGYWDRFTNRVIFPIQSLSGRVIGFGGRILSTDKNKAKYLNSPESDIYHKSYTLYGIYHARKEIVKQNRCILVEGYTDVISMHQSGIENIVASSGTSLTKEQIKLIKRFTSNITIIYDSDVAGLKASLRGIDMILREGMNVRVVLMPDGEDPDSFARSHSAQETNEFIVTNEEDFLTFKTKLLVKDTKNDPIGRASVITDVVNSISEIPDRIIRSQYIKECSRLLDIDENIVNQEVAKRSITTKEGKDVIRYHQNEQNIEAISRNVVLKKDDEDIKELEKELVTYLLRYGYQDMVYKIPNQEPVYLNVAQTIIEELENDNLTFIDSTYSIIFEEYNKLYREYLPSEGVSEDVSEDVNEGSEESRRNITAMDFINHPNQDVAQFVITLMTDEERYRSSKIWKKFSFSENETEVYQPILDVAVPKTLALYKLKIIERIINSLLVDIERGGDLSILKQIDILNESRKLINQKYSRIF